MITQLLKFLAGFGAKRKKASTQRANGFKPGAVRNVIEGRKGSVAAKYYGGKKTMRATSQPQLRACHPTYAATTEADRE